MMHRGYMRHKDCLDTFIYVDKVSYRNEQYTIIKAYWLIQGTEKYWFAADKKKYVINSDQYEKWVPYTPTGELDA